VEIERAKRLAALPPYLFAEIDRLKNEVKARGVDVVDLGVGDPDLPTPDHIIERLAQEARNPAHHRYPSYVGMREFRAEAAKWIEARFGVSFDPDTEVLALIGSKEGVFHLPLGFVNPGDVVLIPNPGYPVYRAGTLFADGEPYDMPLLEENGFLPSLDEIDSDAARRAKMMWINYPNNPTSAVATREFFEMAVDFAGRHGVILCHDMAYSEVSYDGFRPVSIMEIDGARDVAIEFHSLSKTYNMTGWRIAYAVGNPEIVSGLGAVKTNVDSGVFEAVQCAAIEALRCPQSVIQQTLDVYQQRRDILCDGLREAGWNVEKPKAGFFVWTRTPGGRDCREVASTLLNEAGLVVTPGVGFGKYGEGYIRMSLTVDTARLEEAVARFKKARL